MAARSVPLSEIVSVRPRFVRSVHLERDFYVGDAADGYIVTRGSRSALSLLSRGVDQTAYRAQCLSGAYGSGKSALALYFARLLDKTSNSGLRQRARHCLGDTAIALIPPDHLGYLTVLATGSRESIGSCMIRGVEKSLQNSGHAQLLQRLKSKHRTAFKNKTVNTRCLVALFEDLAESAVRDAGCLGLIVIVDELGKLLEYTALHPEDSDIQTLQELAESAARSHDNPFWFITILHQSFSQYAIRLGRRQQQEWSKVQQRFYDIPCRLDMVDAIRLTASALDSAKQKRVLANRRIRKAARLCSRFAPRGSESDFEELAVASYPLHPTALLVLPELFRRFGQNERSLFSYLSADEPFSLTDCIQRREFRPSNPAFVRLPQIYNYACHTLIGGAPPPAIAHSWAEAEDVIARLRDVGEDEIDALKAIALLGLVGEACCLSASRDILELALASPYSANGRLDELLNRLVQRRLIVFRRFRDSYKLWEGSDIDIDERLTSAYQVLPVESAALTVARELCPAPPVVARRHSYRTGMLRSMTLVPCAPSELSSVVDARTDEDGRVVQCLAQTTEQFQDMAAVLRRIEAPSVIVALAHESEELAEAARDVWALDWVGKNTPALSGDRVARQELNERRLEAETAFRREWTRLFGPGSREASWFWQGKERDIRSTRDFASLLSDACDETFLLAPVVQNELINRRRLSSAAAAARRNLVEAMIKSGHLAGLGFTRYPPERSIYESLLVRAGIHRPNDQGQWEFGRPSNTDRGLQEAWDFILSSAQSDDLTPKQVSELFQDLSGPPYGVADGFVPVLLCAVLIAHGSTIALYEDGSFIPELSPATMELLMKRPESFSILAYTVGGERETVIRRFAEGFGVSAGVLPVVRSLYQRMGSLTKYAESTRNLSDEAMAVREVMARAKNPERLLFVDLPKALGCQPFDTSDAGASKNVERFFNALNRAFAVLAECYPLLLDRVRQGLLVIFDIPPDEADWRNEVSRRAAALLETATDTRLRALCVRACDEQLEETAYLESVGAGIVGQPLSRWSRPDEENFGRLLPILAAEVRAAESLQELRSNLGDGEDGYLLSVDSADGRQIRQIVRVPSKNRELVASTAQQIIEMCKGLTDKRLILGALAQAAHNVLSLQRSPQGDAEDSEETSPGDSHKPRRQD